MGKCGARTTGATAGLILGLLAGAGWADCSPDSVELRTSEGTVMRFSVEVADDAAERATGLMNRDHMATSAGMLFVYDAPQHAFFWMKNTLIPLDMIFADATGRVTRVHEMAVPGDETTIDGGEGVRYVLEINGGLAGRLGLAEGAVMRSAVIAQAAAAWPCD
jgi:uncharacterized protein